MHAVVGSKRLPYTEILPVPSVRGNACIEMEGMVRMMMPARIGVG